MARLPLVAVALLLGLIIAHSPPALAQYRYPNPNATASRWDAIWASTWQDFEYWLKRLDPDGIAASWEKRRGERWVRIYVDRSRWYQEPESNRSFLTRALNQNTRWPFTIQAADDYEILAIEGLTRPPMP